MIVYLIEGNFADVSGINSIWTTLEAAMVQLAQEPRGGWGTFSTLIHWETDDPDGSLERRYPTIWHGESGFHYYVLTPSLISQEVGFTTAKEYRDRFYVQDVDAR